MSPARDSTSSRSHHATTRQRVDRESGGAMRPARFRTCGLGLRSAYTGNRTCLQTADEAPAYLDTTAISERRVIRTAARGHGGQGRAGADAAVRSVGRWASPAVAAAVLAVV